jgi:hypothetical protein
MITAEEKKPQIATKKKNSPTIAFALGVVITLLVVALSYDWAAGPPGSKSQVRVRGMAEKMISVKRNLSALNTRVNDLERGLTDLKVKAGTLGADIAILRHDFRDNQTLQQRYDKVYVSPKELGGVQRIDTSMGSFLIGLKDVSPYLDGYKLSISIGNPSSITYTRSEITVRWVTDTLIQTSKTTIIEDLNPGYWNRAEVIISPAKADDISKLEITMETNTVELHRPRE